MDPDDILPDPHPARDHITGRRLQHGERQPYPEDREKAEAYFHYLMQIRDQPGAEDLRDQFDRTLHSLQKQYGFSPEGLAFARPLRSKSKRVESPFLLDIPDDDE